MNAAKIDVSSYFLKAIFIFYIIFALYSNFIVHNEQDFSFLANSFLSGKLHFIDRLPDYSDTSPLNGKYYCPLGPLPAVLMVPGQFFLRLLGHMFYQGYLNVFLGFWVFYLVFKISVKLRYRSDHAFYLSCAFCLSSAFIGVWILPLCWYFAHTIAVALAFLAINEFYGKKRYWVLGSLVGLSLLTRIPAAIIGLLFSLDLISAQQDIKKKIKQLCIYSLPIATAAGLLLGYNYLRFGDMFEQGYRLQIIHGPALLDRSFGVMSLSHVPSNLYYSLINLPTPVFIEGTRVMKFPFLKADGWGMSIFLTSPYLLYLFTLKYRDTFSKLLWISIIAIAMPLFLFFGLGNNQYGYRFSLDFLPLLFLLLIRNYKHRHGELSANFKKMITVSAFLNLYLFLTFLFIRQ